MVAVHRRVATGRGGDNWNLGLLFHSPEFERTPAAAWACGTLLAYGAFILILGSIAIPTLDNPGRRFHTNQAKAVALMREVVRLQLVRAQNFGSYSPTLDALATRVQEGMPEAQPQLLTDQLAHPEEQGYVYTYISGPPDRSGQIRNYSITARPRAHAITGCLSLFADESGVIRATKADRTATAQDPQLGG